MILRAVSKSFPHMGGWLALYIVVGWPLLPHLILGQAPQLQLNSQKELETLLARASSGEVGASEVETIARAKIVEAIPALEAQFAQTSDLTIKAKIADGLVRLGDKDDKYWNFLLQQATLAVDSDLPDPFHDSQGNATGRQLSPDFRKWTQAHNVDVSTAVNSALFGLPGKVLLLGETGDPRGIPLLRRALQSRNYQIVAWAAKGLALIQDKESIPLIITAIRTAPPDYSPLIAEALVYFDDARAQSAVDNYMPREKAGMDRDARARGRGAFGW